MRIELSGAGKRFNREWIFRQAGLALTAGQSYAITGPNGSGKSTLLQSIGGMLQLSEGTIAFRQDGRLLEPESAYRHISFCAPYLDVIEEMTLVEFLLFHRQFKAFANGLALQQVVDIIGLQEAAHKQIRYYSSGMKQRVKLAQAILSDADIILLDEPCTNLDAAGIALYHQLIATYAAQRLVVVSSNDPAEYSFCKEVIDIRSFKAAPVAGSRP